jgi:transcription initiation factor IIF auxiliary subunit
MLSIVRERVIGFGLAAVLGLAASPGAAALAVKNTSSYTGAGRWDWTIFIEADPDTLRQIECVEYVLHPTFPDPVRKVCNQPNTKFAHSTNGWGTFTVKVNIQYKDGRVEALQHRLVFEQQPATAAISVTAKNWSRQIEPGWWEWGIRIEGPPAELERIRCVEYTLHPTFPNPVRVVCSRSRGFELVARGWGTFTVEIKLMLNDGSLRRLSHRLEFR